MMLERARPFCLFLLLAVWGCQDLRNRIDNQVLNCGDDARGSADLWIKVLDPQGEELPELEALDARPLAVDGQGALPSALTVSKKHCVRAAGAESLVVRSRASDRSWSVLVHTRDLSWDHSVRLEDSSQQSARLQCPDPWVNDGRIILPLILTGGMQDEALALSPTLAGPDGRLWAGTFGLQSAQQPLAWPRDWPDGAGRLVLKKKNLLQSDTAKEESCALVVDRVPPTLELTPAPDAAGNLDLRPGSLLRLRMVDAHPGIIRWCLGQESGCLDESLWNQANGEVSLPMPDKGHWFVKARAVDIAGNVSSLFTQAIDVIQRDVVQTIEWRVDQALADKASDGWQAGFNLQQALQDYQRLVLTKEQDLVRNKLIDGILGTAPYIQERQRRTVTGSARKVWALNQDPDSPWLVLTAEEVSLWSTHGDLLGRIPVVDAEIADWSESQQALALATVDQLLVLSLKDKELRVRASVHLSDIDVYDTPADVKWIAGTSQLAMTIFGEVPLIFDWQDASLNVATQLDVKDARIIAVKPGGDMLAVAASDQLSIWRKNKGVWQFVEADERPLRDLRFTAASSQVESKLLVLTNNGRLVSWSPGQVWKDVDKGVPGEIPSEFPNTRSPQYLQPWADGTSGLFERGGRFYQWSSDPNKTLQPVQLSGFNWQELRLWKVDTCRKGLWMLDDRSLSFWQWQNSDMPGFKKSGEWAVPQDAVYDFVSNCNREDREFITLDAEQGRLRFWSQRGPLPRVWNEAGNVIVARFLPGLSEGESLFTSGFGGLIRAWDLAGKKLREFIGHSGQVNEVRFVPELNQFLSSAEDSTSRFWSPDGNEIAALSLPPIARIRDGAILLDTTHIVTTGKDTLTLWTYENSSWKLTITIPLTKGERPHRDSVVRLPARAATAAANTAASASPATGSSPLQPRDRVLVKVQGGLWRGVFISANGDVTNTEPGLPILEGLQRIEWTRDGNQIALIDTEGFLQIFRQESEGWVASSGSIAMGTVQQFAFTPDGKAFALQVDGRLEVWENKEAWSKTSALPLPNELDLVSGLQWTADSARLLYSQNGLVRVHDRQLNVLHQIQTFPNSDPLYAMGVSSDADVFAVGQKQDVRILDLNLERLQAALCNWGLCTTPSVSRP